MDDQPFNLLLTAYFERRDELRRYFSIRLGSQAAADDLVQDIYLRIIRSEPDDIRNPAAFLYRLGTNLMLDGVKQQKRSMRRDEDWRRLEEDEPGTGSIESALAARQRLEFIIQAVNELPPQVQQAFRLHKLEGRSHADTASALGVSRSSVEKYIMQALRHILTRPGS